MSYNTNPFRELPRRKQNRLDGRDYSHKGRYFVTICAKNHANLFGEITDATIKLNEIGELIHAAIGNISLIYPSISVSMFVIMPNHVHLLMHIVDMSNNTAPNLSEIIRQFKGVVTKEAGFSPWQKSFHDHIVRNQISYDKIKIYIKTNPQNWDIDCFHPKQRKYY